jgi:flagellar biosynthesis protein FliR
MTDLFGNLVELAGLARASAFAGLAVFLRVGALMLMLPAFAEQAVPMRVRLALALGFTAIVAPAVMPFLPVTDPFPPMLFATEVIYGLLLGFGIRVFIFVLQVAGAIAAQATTLSQMFGGLGPEPQPIIGNVLTISALALAVSAGLHVKAAELRMLHVLAWHRSRGCLRPGFPLQRPLSLLRCCTMSRLVSSTAQCRSWRSHSWVRPR